jgi:hypothetical protein
MLFIEGVQPLRDTVVKARDEDAARRYSELRRP